KTLAETPASTAILIHDPFARDIAVSFLNSLRDDFGPPIIARLPGPVNRKSAKRQKGIAGLRFAAGCEANHTHVTAPALIRAEMRPPRPARIEPMKARRMAYWWFRLVVS